MPIANIDIAVDDDIKIQAQELFADFGMDISTAVNIFLRQALREQAIPFAIKKKARRAEFADSKIGIDDDKFFSGANLRHLRHSLHQAKSGNITQHELINHD